MTTPYEDEIENFIREMFEQNYEELRLESGRAITPDVKETALNQALLYWRKLREVAENVTDTEVRLSLPNKETPAGRDFTIEGVVDILRDGDQTLMYDIKTNDADQVRANLSQYEQQLNVYAFIWQELRRQGLDGMAVIATDYPETVKEALASRDASMIDYALQEWDPVVPIVIDPDHVEATIREFGCVVDDIEEGHFAPPPIETLNESLPGGYHVRFATRVCRNCDARFSCASYRQYAWSGSRQTAEQKLSQYYGDFPPDPEQETWRSAGLDAARTDDELRADFTRQ
jgi:hypothetical protein